MSDTHTAMDPGAGKAVILEFLRMLCGGDTAQHTRLLDWSTHAMQHPNAPGETALVSGPQRCGESELWKIIRHLLRAHGHAIDVGASEGACIHTDKPLYILLLVPRLRTVMDDGHLNVHELHQPHTTIQMRARVFLTMNVDLDVEENDIERFIFIQCSNARVCDEAYFQALHTAIEDAGTVSAVCKFLRHRHLWARVRAFVHARVVVSYWLGLTEHLMVAGGAAEARDRMDYDMDFM